MRMIDPLLMEFDRECSTTRKLLERIDDAHLDFRPHEKSRTLRELAYHVATLPHWIGGALLADGFDMATRKPPSPPATSAEIVQTFAAGVTLAKEAMAQLDDAKAMGEWSLRMGPVVVFALPRIALVRTILLNHSIHHRGQLSVYLRMVGASLPSIYGPTADENPFG
jgi:uncharacterized damage-inducible protein DinB